MTKTMTATKATTVTKARAKAAFAPHITVNPKVKGELPDNPDVPLGRKVFTGVYGTEIAKGKFVVYNGRLTTTKRLYDGKNAVYTKTVLSSHTLFELAKGLLAKFPELRYASREEFAAELRHQVRHALCKGMTAEESIQFIDGLGSGMLGRVVSTVRRKDVDLELAQHADFHGQHGIPAPTNRAEQTAAVAEIMQRRQQRAFHMGSAMKDTYNALSKKLQALGVPSDTMSISFK